MATVLGLLLAPFLIVVMRDKLHLGCTLDPGTAYPSGWTCPDNIGYVLPGLVLIAVIAGLIFTVRVVVMVRGLARQGAGPDLIRIVARDIGWVGAAPLVLQAPVSVLAALSSTYSSRALFLGVLVGVAGLLPFLMVRARGWLYGAACMVTGTTAMFAATPAVLLAPAIAGCVVLLVCAATVSVIGAAGWVPEGQRTSVG